MHLRAVPLLSLVLNVLVISTPTPLHAASIGLDFGDENATNALVATEIAGIVPQSHWNSFVAVSGVVNRTTPLALVDQSGFPSGATATWSGATNDWSLPISQSGGNNRMMRGYLENINNGAMTFSFLNIPYTFYDVYIYADGEGTSARQATYSYLTSSGLSGSQAWIDPGLTEFNGSFVQNQNYVKFSSLTGANLDLTATVVALRAPVNAIQIVATVPEPSTVAFLALGVSYLCLRHTNKTKRRT